MKNLLLLLLSLLICFSISAQRQGEFIFGAVGGLNVAFPVGDDMEDFVEDLDDYIDDFDDYNGQEASGGIKPKIGMHLGLNFDYFIQDNLSLTSGLIYSQKGFTLKREQEFESSYYNNYPYYNNMIYDVKIKDNRSVNLNYIDVPLGIKFITDEGFQIFGGVMLSFLASESVTYNFDIDTDDPDYESSSYYQDNYEDDYGDYEDAFGDDPEESTTGIFLGVGFTINEKFNINLKVQKTSNFGEIDDENDNQNLTVQLSTGINF